MISRDNDSFLDSGAEIDFLIGRLLATDQRLEELLGGEVDTVTDSKGRTMLLRRAQGELRQSELARQRAILGALPAPIALLDARGEIVSVNTAWRHFADIKASQDPGHVLGQNYLELCDQAQGSDSAGAHEVASGLRKVLAGGLDSFSMEYPCHSPTGQRWFQIVVTPLAGSPPNGAVIQLSNITALKQAADTLAAMNAELELRVASRTAALVRQEALFHALSDQAPVVIWTMDASCSHISYINRAGASLLGGEPEDWIGRTGLPIHLDDVDANTLGLAQALERCEPFVSVRRLAAADGSFRTMSCMTSPVYGPHGTVDFWVGLDMDITELKKVETALRVSNGELETFAYAIAHDMRSPLSVIAGFGTMLQKELTESSTPRAIHLLSRMRAGMHQMDEVTSGLLTLAGLSRTAINRELTDLSQLAREVAQMLQERNPERKASFSIQDGMTALCDHNMMRSLISNLLGNAWKFTAKVACAEISFSAFPNPAGGRGGLVYRIQDNGAGFDMAYQDKLFLPFQRLHSIEEFEGTGIGLATVRKIVERHAGSIRASGVPQQGATMEFTLNSSCVDRSTHAELTQRQRTVSPAPDVIPRAPAGLQNFPDAQFMSCRRV